LGQKPLKVMSIIARLNIGGSAIQVALLAEEMIRANYEHILVHGQIGAHEGDMGYLVDGNTSTTIMIPELGRSISLFRDLRVLIKLYRLMRRHKPDVVHTHTAKAGFVGRIAAWLARVPVRVHTFHGHVFHGYFGPSKTWVFLTLERLCARISTRIIAISPQQRDELSGKYRIAPIEKFVVIPYGLKLQPLTQSPPSDVITNWLNEQGIPKDKKRIGIVGRLVPIKNHQLFLRAAHEVVKQRDDVHFVIVGDGESRPDLENLVSEYQLAGKVTFTGWVRDINTVLHSLDVLALTSENEGTPTAIMEAMAAMTPVVATDVGGVADVLDHGKHGRIVSPGDILELAAALVSVLDGDLPDLARAQQIALERYDTARLFQDTQAVYLASLGRTRDS
jgi:glycosyltransferase involved in cell wall biosynthesis